MPCRGRSQTGQCRLKDKGRIFRETFLGKLGLLLYMSLLA